MDELIRWASELHAASGVANAVLENTSNANFAVAEVVALIERDPGLTTRVLAVVNSSRFGLSQKVSNLQQAVAMLGQKTLRTIALSFSVVESFSAGVDERVHQEFWRRSLTTSLVADRLSRQTKGVNSNDAYIAGLLADVGVLALAQFKPEAYLPIYRSHQHNGDLVEAEEAAFGFNHAVFGARLLEVWKFPPLLSEAVAMHHSEEIAENNLLARIILAGHQLPDAIWISREEEIHAACEYFERQFRFDVQQFIELAIEVNQAVAREAEMFEIGGIGAVSDDVLEIIRERYGLAAHK